MSAWNDFVTAGLLGTGKSGTPALPPELEAALAGAAGLPPEVRFLTEAGALALWRQAGWQPGKDDAEVSTALPETATLPIHRISAAHLRTMLGGRCAGVLPEWLREAARLGRHAPPELLPALLERARKDTTLRPLAMAVGGERARWLAAQNPSWAFGAPAAADMWETGNRDERASFLRTLRASDPAEARARVEAVWSAEAADVRTALLGELRSNLSSHDEPFLESTLDDRSKEVRRVAIDLLARLPSSQFTARMLQRATPLLAWKRGGLLSRAMLEVTLPPEPDAAALRDGLEPKAFGQQKTLGDRAVLLVLILSTIPLRHWTGTFDQEPAAILKAAEKAEFARALATGWAWAALRQGDTAWALALLDGGVAPHAEFLPPTSLLSLLPEADRAKHLATALHSDAFKTGDPDVWRSLAEQLFSFPGFWPPGLAREVLAALRLTAQGGVPWHLRSSIDALILKIPPALLPEATQGWALEDEGVPAIIELITFRHDALTALSQP